MSLSIGATSGYFLSLEMRLRLDVRRLRDCFYFVFLAQG